MYMDIYMHIYVYLYIYICLYEHMIFVYTYIYVYIYIICICTLYICTSFFLNFLPFSIHDNVPHFLVLFVFKTIGAHTFCGTFHFSILCIFYSNTQTPTNPIIQSCLSSVVVKELRRYEHLIFLKFLTFINSRWCPTLSCFARFQNSRGAYVLWDIPFFFFLFASFIQPPRHPPTQLFNLTSLVRQGKTYDDMNISFAWISHSFIGMWRKTCEHMNASFFSNFLPFSIQDNLPHFLVLFVFKTIGAHTFCGTFHSSFCCIFRQTSQIAINPVIQSYCASGAEKEVRGYENLIRLYFLTFLNSW